MIYTFGLFCDALLQETKKLDNMARNEAQNQPFCVAVAISYFYIFLSKLRTIKGLLIR
ncbi:hypothetical protein [Clostridium formicaceticum]|jgi:hypothetical protein|uniref:Uncharacterized protein n=1 Tax=Clostridium formicaceticum TaxID=1497 RepID=A0AAC9RLF0_9CLOT|nr:hypothetical protein [Clostridium formicaceticum]ARE89269.1 hypothetical protein CLFO_36760 [Clostridium formicaceticum]